MGAHPDRAGGSRFPGWWGRQLRSYRHFHEVLAGRSSGVRSHPDRVGSSPFLGGAASCVTVLDALLLP